MPAGFYKSAGALVRQSRPIRTGSALGHLPPADALAVERTAAGWELAGVPAAESTVEPLLEHLEVVRTAAEVAERTAEVQEQSDTASASQAEAEPSAGPVVRTAAEALPVVVLAVAKLAEAVRTQCERGELVQELRALEVLSWVEAVPGWRCSRRWSCSSTPFPTSSPWELHESRMACRAIHPSLSGGSHRQRDTPGPRDDVRFSCDQRLLSSL